MEKIEKNQTYERVVQSFTFTLAFVLDARVVLQATKSLPSRSVASYDGWSDEERHVLLESLLLSMPLREYEICKIRILRLVDRIPSRDANCMSFVYYKGTRDLNKARKKVRRKSKKKKKRKKVIPSFRLDRASRNERHKRYKGRLHSCIEYRLWLPTKVVAEFHIWIDRRNRRVLNSRRFHRSTATTRWQIVDSSSRNVVRCPTTSFFTSL